MGEDAGWLGVGTEWGKFVPEQDAFTAACCACGIEQYNPDAPDAAAFYEMLIEWYFSGNWIWCEGRC